MKRIVFALVSLVALVAFSATALASVTLTNKDSQRYELRIATSDSCFSGTDTSIGGNTTSTFTAGWLCIDKKKPAYKIEDGKAYVIEGGKVAPK